MPSKKQCDGAILEEKKKREKFEWETKNVSAFLTFHRYNLMKSNGKIRGCAGYKECMAFLTCHVQLDEIQEI